MCVYIRICICRCKYIYICAYVIVGIYIYLHVYVILINISVNLFFLNKYIIFTSFLSSSWRGGRSSKEERGGGKF